MNSVMNAREAANWFISHNTEYVKKDGAEYISNMKLQKLLYFAQGAFLALTEKPLFDEDIKAWEHGPVVPEVYHTFKSNRNKGIKSPKGSIGETDALSAGILLGVYESFGKFSALELRNKTHFEGPWREIYEPNSSHSIPQEAIREYFKNNDFKSWLDDTLFDYLPLVDSLPLSEYDPSEDAIWEAYL